MFNVQKLKGAFLLFLFLFSLGVISTNAVAEVRVLAIGGGLTPPYATEEIFANGEIKKSYSPKKGDKVNNIQK